MFEQDSSNEVMNHSEHPRFRQNLTLGQKGADAIAKFGGSWIFISFFALVLIFWISLNTWFLLNRPFDPFPFILLNLALSCLAALQAPIILMSQNRQAERDRIDAAYDHAVNRKAEREIEALQKDITEIKNLLKKKKN